MSNTPHLINNKGTVIAFHCVPQEISPEIEKFYSILNNKLLDRGFDFLLITTTNISDLNIKFLKVPYLPLQYKPSKNKSNITPNKSIIELLSSWYNLSHNKSHHAWENVYNFFESLISALEPAFLLSWQSANPVSRIVKQICTEKSIPWSSAERGWVKNTLMIDTNENNYLSEINSSFILKNIYKNYEVNNQLISSYESKIRSEKTLERYPINRNSTLPNHRYGLNSNSKIYALFTHGEPHISTISGLNNLQLTHSLSRLQLENYVTNVANYLLDKDSYLIIKEHPFNIKNNLCLNLPNLKNIIKSEDSIDLILANSDYLLFTLSTLQFDIALKGNKPFGLLSRGILSEINAAPFIGDFDDISLFIMQFTDPICWSIRKIEILRKISFLLEYVLLNLDQENIDFSTEKFAEHLEFFRGKPQNLGFKSLVEFLKSNQ